MHQSVLKTNVQEIWTFLTNTVKKITKKIWTDIKNTRIWWIKIDKNKIRLLQQQQKVYSAQYLLGKKKQNMDYKIFSLVIA